MLNDKLEILGARTHNLQNISLSVPRNSLITITGLSGSGKSSLAFDTIYAEGQRRYLETFSSYIRNFIGNIGRPDVDKITGLSPVISIEQKTTNKNPRSTVGTTTEIYDLLRLLFARISQAYSINTGEKMVKYSEKQIIQEIESSYNDSSIIILAPVVKGRKGHYRELFESITKKGFLKVRIDGKIENLVSGLRVDRYKVHDIEIVIDKLKISSDGKQERLKKSIETAFKHGKNSLMIIDENEKIRHFSRLLMCPTTGISYPEPEPNTFSFNSPYGACPFCNGLGEVTQVEIDKIIPDRKKSIANGGLIPIGKPNMNSWFVKQISQIGISYDFSLDTAFEDYTEQALNVLLYGECKDSAMPNDFKGVVNFIASQFNEGSVPASIQKWAASFMSNKTCPHCNGRRLKEESLHFRIGDKNIADLANMDLTELSQWCIRIEEFLSPRENEIASEILREINTKINFLLDVGLGYLSLNRSTRSLSGGESQRIRLATQIGSKLVNVMYILDEPSIGLHQTDNIRLIESLKRLRDLGNTVIVVEHDKDMMLASDYIIDIGPGAGINGGQLTAIGSPKDILKQNSITCQYLKGEKKIPTPTTRREGNGKHIHLNGACGNNLKNVNLDIP